MIVYAEICAFEYSGGENEGRPVGLGGGGFDDALVQGWKVRVDDLHAAGVQEVGLRMIRETRLFLNDTIWHIVGGQEERKKKTAGAGSNDAH